MLRDAALFPAPSLRHRDNETCGVRSLKKKKEVVAFRHLTLFGVVSIFTCKKTFFLSLVFVPALTAEFGGPAHRERESPHQDGCSPGRKDFMDPDLYWNNRSWW